MISSEEIAWWLAPQYIWFCIDCSSYYLPFREGVGRTEQVGEFTGRGYRYYVFVIPIFEDSGG